MSLRKYRPGPGMMVSAAFIGPGTVTACTLAGANFGFALVWALVFATATTIILQSFAVRISLVTKMGLAEAMMESISNPLFKGLIALILLTALALGNAAYEAGNISGAVLGLQAIAEGSFDESRTGLVLMIVLLAGSLIMIGNPRWLTKILIALVLFMSLSFLLTFLLSKPDILSLLSGLRPQIPDGGLMTAIALIGTTIVPYNLFLHAATVKEHWQDESQLPEAQTDNLISIGIGGLVSIIILATAAAAMWRWRCRGNRRFCQRGFGCHKAPKQRHVRRDPDAATPCATKRDSGSYCNAPMHLRGHSTIPIQPLRLPSCRRHAPPRAGPTRHLR